MKKKFKNKFLLTSLTTLSLSASIIAIGVISANTTNAVSINTKNINKVKSNINARNQEDYYKNTETNFLNEIKQADNTLAPINNSYTGNSKNFNLAKIDYEGDTNKTGSSTNNVNFTIKNTSKLINDNLIGSNLSDSLIEANNTTIDFNNWNIDKSQTYKLSNSNLKNAFNATNIKINERQKGFYTSKEYMYDLTSKNGFSLSSEWINNQNFSLGKKEMNITAELKDYPLYKNPSGVVQSLNRQWHASSSLISDINNILNNTYYPIVGIKITAKDYNNNNIEEFFDINSLKQISHLEVTHKIYSDLVLRPNQSNYGPPYVYVRETFNTCYIILNSKRIINKLSFDSTSRIRNFKIDFLYKDTKTKATLKLNPNIKLENSKINNINKVTTYSDVKPETLIKIKLKDANKYSNNGLVWTTAPKLEFGVNEEILEPTYQLYKLKRLNDKITQNINDKQYSLKVIRNLENLQYNITFLNKTYKQYEQDYENILKGQNVLIDDTSRIKLFDDYNMISPIAKDVSSWDTDYFVILDIFKNKKITANYTTPTTDKVKTVDIWNGNQFGAITADDVNGRNSNYINITALKYSSNTKTNQTLDLHRVKYDKNFNNIEYKNNTASLTYNFLYRADAKNSSNVYVDDAARRNPRSIELPLEKYVSEYINRNNNFVRGRETEIISALNKVIKAPNIPELFAGVYDINGILGVGQFVNRDEVLNYFNLKYKYSESSEIDFVRNDQDGIFYVVGRIQNWYFKYDNKENQVNGDFTKEFVDKLLSNPDIRELKRQNSTNDGFGYFLIKVKTAKTSNSIKFSNDLETWKPSIKPNYTIDTDSNNPLKVLNTPENLATIQDFFKDKNNLKKDTKTKTEVLEDKKEYLITTTTYSIDKTKTINLSLENGFGGTFTQDYKSYLDNQIIGFQNSEVPSLEYDFLEKVYHSHLNFANNETGSGKLVSRRLLNLSGSPRYEYKLNDKYELKLTKNDNYISNINYEYTAYIVDKGSNKFSYPITVKELTSIFDYQYNNDRSELKEEYLKRIEKQKEDIEKLTDVKRDEIKPSIPDTPTIKPSIPDTPTIKPSIPDLPSTPQTQSNTAGAVIGGTIAGLVIAIGSGTFAYVFCIRKKAKKQIEQMYKVDDKKEE